MIAVMLLEDERRVVVPGDELVIGRARDAQLMLDVQGISRRHARLVRSAAGLHLEDLGSTNGTRVDGVPVRGRVAVAPGVVVEVGAVRLRVEPGTVEPCVEASAAEPGGGDAEADLAAVRRDVQDRLIEALDLRRLPVERLGGEDLRQRAQAAVARIIDEARAGGRIAPAASTARLARDVLDEALGLGPLEALLRDDDVSEIMVNHARQIFVERRGRLERSDHTFSSDAAVLAVIERIVAPLGRRIDESSPLVDARLPDGSRVNAVIPPLALKGPGLTIRKFRRERLGIDDLVRSGTLTPEMAWFLEMCVRARKNLVISGGTGSGKTTLLNVVSSFIPAGERIVTVEDAAELQLPQEHWVQLETRPANLEGKGAIGVRDLVRNCLRMRPDRIVVGECRGGETLDMLQAMNTGHDGSLTTLHANSPRDAIARMETMVLMSGVELPVRAIREQIAGAVHVIVQQARLSDGSRRVTRITEVTGMEGDVVTLQDIFGFRQEGRDAEGRVRGRHAATGLVPRLCQELESLGLPQRLECFR